MKMNKTETEKEKLIKKFKRDKNIVFDSRIPEYTKLALSALEEEGNIKLKRTLHGLSESFFAYEYKDK